MQTEVPQLDLTSHQPPTEIYLYENDDKLDDTDMDAMDAMDAETPAHGNLSMKTSQSPELIEPMAPKPFSPSAKMFTFEGLTPVNSASDESRSPMQVGEDAAQTNADSEDREEHEPSAVAESEPKSEINQPMQPTEAASKPQILPKRIETPKENAETPRTGPRRYERYMVDAIIRKDDASDNSAPFDEEPISSPCGASKSKKKNDRVIPDHRLPQQKAIEEEIIFGTTQLTIGTLDADDSVVEGRPVPCPEVQAFVASLGVEDEIAMAPTDEMEELSTIYTVHETPPRNYTAALCGELDKMQLFDMEWCAHR